MPSEPRKSTAIRLKPDIHAGLSDYARGYEVSLNWLVNRILADALENGLTLDFAVTR
jgi:predicted HicB family RNase H-like nuclease